MDTKAEQLYFDTKAEYLKKAEQLGKLLADMASPTYMWDGKEARQEYLDTTKAKQQDCLNKARNYTLANCLNKARSTKNPFDVLDYLDTKAEHIANLLEAGTYIPTWCQQFRMKRYKFKMQSAM